MNLIWQTKSPPSFKIELLANFAGTGWSAVTQLACIPLYIKFMGIEAYGLIGFYLTLQGVLWILDLGLSPTMNREMARYSVQPGKAAEARDLVRTLEVGYWLLGVVIGGAIWAAAPSIATHWIKAGTIPVETIRQAIGIMGILAFFQWPISLYQGGLMGLRRQVLFNALKIVVATLSNGGALLVLWLVSPTIKAFLLWQVAVSAAQALLIALLFWTNLPSSERAPRFDLAILRDVWRFAAGVSGITLTSLILMQIDKVLVSKLVSLEIFGYYTLAWTVANGFQIIGGAVFYVVFPRMSAQVAAEDEEGLKQSYHRSSQLIAALVLPAAAVVSLFSFQVLQLWTGSIETARYTAPIVSVLVIGSALNGLLQPPYALQLAFGWTKLNLVAGLLSITIVIPAIFPMTKYFGPVGAASVWAVLNIVNMLVVVPIMHRRLLPHEAWGYFRDVGFPLASTLGVAMIGRLVFGNLGSPIMALVGLSSMWLVGLVMAVLAAPQIRAWVLTHIMKEKPSYA